MAILEAVLRVVAQSGAAGVSHRAVAAAAGVPLAATTYYFASRDDLLARALEHAAERELSRVAAFLAEPRDAADVVEMILGALERDPVALAAEWELYLAAARTPALRDAARRCTDAYLRASADLLRAAGSRDPDGDARLLVACFDGLLLARHAEGRDAPLAPSVRRLVGALLA